jgi:hypothetical protein
MVCRADFIRTALDLMRFAHSYWSLTTFFDVDLSTVEAIIAKRASAIMARACDPAMAG